MKRGVALASTAAVLAAACSLAGVAGGTAGAAPGADSAAAQAAQVAAGSGYGPSATLAGMTEAQKIGQLFMAGVPATGPVSSAISTDITTYHTGSVILTGRSSAGVTATRQFTNQLQGLATSAATGGVPLFMATDQEGGNVQVLSGPGFSAIPTALSQGGEGAALHSNWAAWGGQLASAGVNLDLAPVLDTVPASIGTANAPIGFYDREYGYTPAAVTSAGTAVLDGMQEAGVSATIKHFPGLGRASGNTDTTYGVKDTVTTYNDPYLQPYSAAIHLQGVPVVMVSLAIYTKIDAAHQAVFSPAVVGASGMLRGELGFHGAIMSDSMDAAAVSELTPAQRAVDFINAGGDIVLVTNPGDIPAMYNAVTAEYNASPAFAALVNQAALHVLIAKEQTGLTGGTVGAASSGNGQVTLVERTSGRSVAAFLGSGGTWTGPVQLGGSIIYQPAAAAIPGTTNTEVVAVAGNGAAYVNSLSSSGTSSGWTSIGGTVSAPPAIAATTGGQLAVVVRGPHDAVWFATYAPATGWTGWTDIGGTVQATPIGVTYTATGDLDVFVTGTNDSIFENVRHAGAWSGWQALGGTVTGGPAAVSIPGGPVQVFAQGPGGIAVERTYSGSWSAWTSLGGVLTSSPAAAASAAGTSSVVANGTDGRLYQDTFSGGTWSGWSLLPFD